MCFSRTIMFGVNIDGSLIFNINMHLTFTRNFSSQKMQLILNQFDILRSIDIKNSILSFTLGPPRENHRTVA